MTVESEQIQEDQQRAAYDLGQLDHRPKKMYHDCTMLIPKTRSPGHGSQSELEPDEEYTTQRDAKLIRVQPWTCQTCGLMTWTEEEIG